MRVILAILDIITMVSLALVFIKQSSFSKNKTEKSFKSIVICEILAVVCVVITAILKEEWLASTFIAIIAVIIVLFDYQDIKKQNKNKM